ncbi:hypothetical protein [Methylosinus sporium]|uniref:hypothetical protein n=1 Tax=Methylosinus sporium TaxID=428 RepID=UPI00383BBC7E
MDDTIADLLADRDADKAHKFMLSYEERRIASWADAQRDAAARAATSKHLPHSRGQLRHHYGERALAESAAEAGCGHLPFTSLPPGGVCVVARVGRFALVSVKVGFDGAVPRKSVMRELLARPNAELDPQGALFGSSQRREKPTELAYFGCLVAVPMRRDPSVPSILAFAVPSTTLDRWFYWTPLSSLHAALQKRMDRRTDRAAGTPIPDRAFPKLRIPKAPDESAGGDASA